MTDAQALNALQNAFNHFAASEEAKNAIARIRLDMQKEQNSNRKIAREIAFRLVDGLDYGAWS